MRQDLVTNEVMSEVYLSYVQKIRDLYVNFMAHPSFSDIENRFAINNELWDDFYYNCKQNIWQFR